MFQKHPAFGLAVFAFLHLVAVAVILVPVYRNLRQAFKESNRAETLVCVASFGMPIGGMIAFAISHVGSRFVRRHTKISMVVAESGSIGATLVIWFAATGANDNYVVSAVVVCASFLLLGMSLAIVWSTLLSVVLARCPKYFLKVRAVGSVGYVVGGLLLMIEQLSESYAHLLVGAVILAISSIVLFFQSIHVDSSPIRSVASGPPAGTGSEPLPWGWLCVAALISLIELRWNFNGYTTLSAATSPRLASIAVTMPVILEVVLLVTVNLEKFAIKYILVGGPIAWAITNVGIWFIERSHGISTLCVLGIALNVLFQSAIFRKLGTNPSSQSAMVFAQSLGNIAGITSVMIDNQCGIAIETSFMVGFFFSCVAVAFSVWNLSRDRGHYGSNSESELVVSISNLSPISE